MVKLVWVLAALGAVGWLVFVSPGSPTNWGLDLFVRELVRLPRFVGWATPILHWYHRLGPIIVIGTVGWFVVVARRHDSVDRWKLIAASVAIVVILMPGVRLEHALLAIPLLLVASPIVGVVYGILLVIGAIFVLALDVAMPGALFGIVGWCVLIGFVWSSIPRATVEDAKPQNRSIATIGISILALVVREALAWVSVGSADIGIFEYFSDSIRAHGLFWLYAHEKGFNHPPLPGYWAAAAGWVADLTHLRFDFIFKQPIIIADVIVCVLLTRIWKTQIWISLVYALCPIAILLCGHHGNTDPIYAMLCLLAAYMLHDRRSFFGAGLALGAAINIKFIPVILIPVFAALAPNWRVAARFLAGLSIMSIPFLPLLIWQRDSLLRNVIGYSSTIDYWGIQQFLMESARVPRFSAVAQSLANAYHDRGRWIVLAAIVMLALLVRRRRWSHERAYEAAALGATIFLILAPGFGLQYLAFVTPLLFATRPTSAIVFGTAAGLFALFNYWINWPSGLPIDSTGIATPPRTPGPLFGLLAWITLITFAYKEFRR